MAEMKGTTVGILVRIGTGEPVEVAEIEVPLRAQIMRNEQRWHDGRVTTDVYIMADWDTLNNDVRAALIRAAEEMPTFAPIGMEKDHE